MRRKRPDTSNSCSNLPVNSSVRRSPFLVTYWEGGKHWIYNYLTRTKHEGTASTLAILEATSQWTVRAEVRGALDDEGDVDAAIDDMVTNGLLDATGRKPSATESALSAWSRWNPVGGFFHAATKTLGTPPVDGKPRELAAFRFERDFPPALKHYTDRPRVKLPLSKPAKLPADVLQQRRTWREFGARKLTLAEISTLLGTTFGVQQWMDSGYGQFVALKSSPSGGARHSIEAYVLAFEVEGLECGTYHYCPDTHALTLLPPSTSKELLKTFVPEQPGFHDPAAFIVMTSVFARMQYKYPHPHAYRVVLLDAGHLGQTFALVATSLRLAPFCTAAIDAPRIEQHLEIDGIGEGVVFAVGVGARPDGKDWAPHHDRSLENPRMKPPAFADRLY